MVNLQFFTLIIIFVEYSRTKHTRALRPFPLQNWDWAKQEGQGTVFSFVTRDTLIRDTIFSCYVTL